MPAPTTAAEVEACYRELIALHTATQDSWRARQSRILGGIGFVVLVIVALTVHSVHSAGSPWALLGAFVAIAALIPFSLRTQAQVTRQQRILGHYDRALSRLDGTAPEPETLPARPATHLYEHDLDLLGPDSLFTLLSTVRTGLGEHGLTQYLLRPAPHTDTVARQNAVRELLPQLETRERIALLGASSFQQITATYFEEWLDAPAPAFNRIFRPVLLITATLDLVLLLTGLTHLRPWGFVVPNLAIVLGIQAAVCAYLRAEVLPLLQGGARLQGNIRLLSEGLALLQASTPACPKLAYLKRQALEPAGAVRLLKQLDGQLTIVEQRTKEYFFIFSLLLAAGTQAAVSIAAWKRANAQAMRTWIAAWAEFEALNALATYAFEHPQNCWPELLPPEHPPLYEAKSLGHPLLAGAVPNDVALGAATSFYLISGSNMSGKSTLLRSIGINAVLAYAGAPVQARSMRLTPLALGASLALTDSLAEGKSRFKAEVARLAAIVAIAKEKPVLFLIDEIFSGTNSADRRTAAAAVLRALLNHHGIGALSTHDLALTELAMETNAGRNLHMASPDPADPLAFDYLLKPGVNTSSNALAIVRMMGLEA